MGRPITLIIPPERHDEERMILDRLRRGERSSTSRPSAWPGAAGGSTSR